MSTKIDQLSEAKRALLAQRLRGEDRASDRARRLIPRRSTPGPAPLSFAQQSLWFLEKLDPGNAFYHVVEKFRLRGRLRFAALDAGLREIVRRHEILRTSLIDRGAGPVQVARRLQGWRTQRVDLESLPEPARREELQRVIVTEERREFDLVRGPLFRACLISLGAEEHVAVFVIHHVAADGWSWRVLLRELAALYRAALEGRPSPLPPLAIQYADYAVWQRGVFAGEAVAAQLAYWRQQLAGLPVLELPLDRPRGAVQTHRGGRWPVTLSAELADSLRALGREQGVTLFVTLLAVFKVLLARHGGGTEVVVGSPFANRERPEIEALIGCFVNTLVLRTDLGGNPSFRELLGRVQEVFLGALTHRDVPFERLVEELQPERSLSHNPLFQVMFVLQDGMGREIDLPGLAPEFLPLESQGSGFDLFLELSDDGRDLRGVLQYAADLLDGTTVARLVGGFGTLARAIASHPDMPIWQLGLLQQPERHQIVVEWNDTATGRPRGRCLHELFERQAERTPRASAVAARDRKLTYQELDERAERLACRLRALGVGPEGVVALFLERTVEMVIALLATLKAGGAYVALDPQYPRERLAFMLDDAGAGVLLTQSHLTSVLPEHTAEVVLLDAEPEPATAGRSPNPCAAVPGNLAYLIYTSGSTGRPKGVAIEHRSAAAFVEWALGVFPRQELARVLASTSICFDLSIFEIFVTLSSGGSVTLVESLLDVPELRGLDVTLINTVPSAMTELVRLDALPASVRTVNLAGEALRRDLVDRIYERGAVDRVLNLYGPSEDTTYSTYTVLSADARSEPSIGRPIGDTQVYLLDLHMNPVPPGVPGELYLGGEGLARGYLGRPALTAERFVPNPFAAAPGSRLYWTGDLARWRVNGEVDFIGRLDQQVKLRGFRIELGEVETLLGGAPGVGEAVVLAREDEGGQMLLVAYLVPDQASPPKVEELRAWAQKTLPQYMVPSAFVVLDKFPRTPGGKVDRRALPAPLRGRAEADREHAAPSTPTEEVLADIWGDVLGRDGIGVGDDFFDIGGHSLRAMQVVSRVQDAFGVSIPVRALFETRTVARLAPLIEETLTAEIAGMSDAEARRLLDLDARAEAQEG